MCKPTALAGLRGPPTLGDPETAHHSWLCGGAVRAGSRLRDDATARGVREAVEHGAHLVGVDVGAEQFGVGLEPRALSERAGRHWVEAERVDDRRNLRDVRGFAGD